MKTWSMRGPLIQAAGVIDQLAVNAHGFIGDYKVKEHELTTVSPNPAVYNTSITYRLTNPTSAYLVLSMPYSNVNNQYILNAAGSQTTLDLSTVPTGIYQLVLVVNGVAVDQALLTVL